MGGEPERDEVLDLGGRRSGRGLTAVVTVVIALVLTAIGFAIAERSGGGHPRASAGTSTPTPHTTPARTPPPLKIQVIHVGSHPDGILGHWQLFARGDTSVTRIDFSAGLATVTPVPRLASTGPVAFIALPHSAIIRPIDLVPGYRVADGQPASQLTGALGRGGIVLPGPRADELWVESDYGQGREFTLIGAAQRRSLLVTVGDAFPTSDGAGHLVVITPTRTWLITSHGPQLFARGSLLTATPARMLVQLCHRNRCHVVVIDRRTGRQHDLPGPTQSAMSWLLAPNGRVAAVFSRVHGRLQLGLIDLRTGRLRVVAGHFPAPTSFESGAMIWSPDSRWLLLAGQHVMVVDEQTAAARALTLRGIHLPAISQLAVRPGT